VRHRHDDDDPLVIAGAEIVTVAIRRTNIGQNPGEPNLLDVLPPDRYTILPNTAGCYTADDAVRTCAWRANCSTATPGQAGSAGRPATLFPTCGRPSRPPRSWSRTASR
jgi:hypothetical protein